ncbi:hypothetical protein, partial [Rubrolithibacter danxiaensis]|uniref:hypothetical protein n=1 Tax=Rubrolithibacter danxiaensis TaxID=3390805 RepID=UPI003BF86F72
MIKKFFSILLCLFSFLKALSQITGTLQPVVPPSPNAAALGKYADIPVSYHTGVPNISIPIYELKEGSLTLPISLSYHATGIKVAETASWVGLGWALNAGGIITRTIMNVPDEGKPNGWYYPHPGQGYYQTGHTLVPDVCICSDQVAQLEEFKRTAKKIVDNEPDIFFFNFNGYSGKFMFKVTKNTLGQLERTPIMIPASDIKVQVNNSAFSSLTLTTPDGVKYFFGENGAKESSATYFNYYPDNDYDHTISNWYLTRIVSPEGRVINLEYGASEEYTFPDLAPERLIGVPPTDPCKSSSGKDVSITAVKGKRLTKITASNVEIEFSAETARADLAANNKLDFPADQVNSTTYGSLLPFVPKRLDRIIIRNTFSGNLIKEFAFAYNYFSSSTESGTTIRNGGSFQTDIKRLKLLSLTEKSSGGASLPPYVFEYDETSLPRRISTYQDTWGYFNAKGKPTLINAFILCGTTSDSFEPNPYTIQAGLLKTITYPVGARTEFTYGLHNPKAAGLRIEKITTNDGLGNIKTKEYLYENGVVFSNPVYVMDIYWNQSMQVAGHPVSFFPKPDAFFGDPAPKFEIFSSSSVIPMQTTQGNSIGYQIVREKESGNGETLYLYDRGLNSDYTNLQYPLIAGSPYFDGSSVGYPTSYSQIFSYRWRPPLYKFNRGNLLRKAVLDEAGNTLYEENFQYEPESQNVTDTTFKATKVELFTDANQDEFVMFSHYPIFLGKSRLVQKEEKVLNKPNNTYLITTTDYTYGSNNHLLATEIRKSTSTGEQLVERTKYSFDYKDELGNTTGNTSGIRKLVSDHILTPIESYTYKQKTDGTNKRVIAGSLNLYQETASNPSEIKALNLTSPIPLSGTNAYQPSVINGTGFFADTRYKSKVKFNGYDDKGNLLSQQKDNNPSKSYLWGYNKTFPIVEVINARNDVTVTSNPGTQAGSIIYNSGNASQTKTASFTTTSAGTISLNISFGSNPGASASASYDYSLIGDNINEAGTLCISVNSTCSNSSISFVNIPSGTYTLKTIYNTNTAASTININYSYPGIETTRTEFKEFYFENFEEDGEASSARAHTGLKCNYDRSFPVLFSPPNNTRPYIISWHQWDGTKWVYKEETYAGGKTFASVLYVDDIRVYPKDAQMTTYTYEPLEGMTSRTDEKGQTTYYEYDDFQRLAYIKDQYGN